MSSRREKMSAEKDPISLFAVGKQAFRRNGFALGAGVGTPGDASSDVLGRRPCVCTAGTAAGSDNRGQAVSGCTSTCGGGGSFALLS